MIARHVIVTGSRHWDDSETVRNVLGELLQNGLKYVSVGDCKTGADLIARDWCCSVGVAPLVFVADWNRLGKSAGPARNQDMVDAGGDVCIGFVLRGSVGTLDCLERASKAGIQCAAYLEPERRRITWSYPGLPRVVAVKRRP